MIHIIDDWYMNAESGYYTVGQRKIYTKGKYKGKPYLVNMTYHRTVSRVITRVMQEYQTEVVRQSDDIGLNELLQKFKEIEVMFENIVGRVQNCEVLKDG